MGENFKNKFLKIYLSFGILFSIFVTVGSIYILFPYPPDNVKINYYGVFKIIIILLIIWLFCAGIPLYLIIRKNKTSQILLLVLAIILALSFISISIIYMMAGNMGGTKILIVDTSCPEKFDQEWYRVDIIGVNATHCSLGITDSPKKLIYTEYANGSKVSTEKTSGGYPDTYMLMDIAYLKWKEQNYSADVLYVDADNDGKISIGDYIMLKSKDAGGFFTDDMRVRIRGDFIRGEYRC